MIRWEYGSLELISLEGGKVGQAASDLPPSLAWNFGLGNRTDDFDTVGQVRVHQPPLPLECWYWRFGGFGYRISPTRWVTDSFQGAGSPCGYWGDKECFGLGLDLVSLGLSDG